MDVEVIGLDDDICFECGKTLKTGGAFCFDCKDFINGNQSKIEDIFDEFEKIKNVNSELKDEYVWQLKNIIAELRDDTDHDAIIEMIEGYIDETK